MELALALGAAAIGAAFGWPGAQLIGRLSVPAGPGAPGSPASRWPAWRVSLMMALLAFAVGARLHPGLVAAAGLWLVLCGVPLAAIDVNVRRLPDLLTATCLGGLVIVLTLAAGLDNQWASLIRAGAGGVALAGLLAVLALARPGSAGLGDAKLAVSTAGLAAWFGWGVLIESVFAAFLLAAACGLVLIAARRVTLRDGSLPFGPFLLAGCLTAVLLAGRAGAHWG
jgi:leader peptidase (prepilin peptidase)/N-methyltransferase